MANNVEFQVAMNWSIKKETFINMNENMRSTHIETTIPGYKYYFKIDQNDGYVAIYFNDTKFQRGTTIKEMTLSIPSAGFIGDLTKVADAPKGHYFEECEETVVFKYDEILNPEKKFFVDDILTMEFRGTVEYSKQPESLGETLWKSNSKDFTFIIQKNMKTDMERKVHKFILREYSSVFREMIDSNVNHFDIDHFDHSAVLAVVKCCYDVLLQGNWRPYVEELLESLRFTNVYDMPIIKERITKHLSGIIDATNVCKIANKSLEYDAPLLKSQCISFISKCIKNRKTYDDAINLNFEIIKELYTTSLCQTVIS